MTLRDQLLACMRCDNVEQFNQILVSNAPQILPPLISDGLYQAALFSSAKILKRMLEIPAFTEYLDTNHTSRESFIDTAMSNSKMDVLCQIFDQPILCADISSRPFEVLLALARNKDAPMALSKLQSYINVDQYITLNNNQVWINAFVNGNYPGMNRFLEFPAVFASIDLDGRYKQQREYIDTYFMKYYFNNLPKSLTVQETELAYLVLQNLIRTYPQRDQILHDVKMIAEHKRDSHNSNTFFYRSSKQFSHFCDRYISKPKNVHAHRIDTLMAIPSVLKKAEDNSSSSLDTVLSAAKIILEESNLHPRSRLRG